MINKYFAIELSNKYKSNTEVATYGVEGIATLIFDEAMVFLLGSDVL